MLLAFIAFVEFLDDKNVNKQILGEFWYTGCWSLGIKKNKCVFCLFQSGLFKILMW